MIELIEVIVLQAALSSVIHVPRDAPTPQAAVDQAQPGDTVLLARATGPNTAETTTTSARPRQSRADPHDSHTVSQPLSLWGQG